MKTLQVVRAAYGALLLTDPRLALRLGRGPEGDRAQRTVVRILGARHLLQAAVCARWPTSTVRRVGGFTDALHAATEFLLAAFDQPRRRAATLDAVIAIGFAAATLATTS